MLLRDGMYFGDVDVRMVVEGFFVPDSGKLSLVLEPLVPITTPSQDSLQEHNRWDLSGGMVGLVRGLMGGIVREPCQGVMGGIVMVGLVTRVMVGLVRGCLIEYPAAIPAFVATPAAVVVSVDRPAATIVPCAGN